MDESVVKVFGSSFVEKVLPSQAIPAPGPSRCQALPELECQRGILCFLKVEKFLNALTNEASPSAGLDEQTQQDGPTLVQIKDWTAF